MNNCFSKLVKIIKSCWSGLDGEIDGATCIMSVFMFAVIELIGCVIYLYLFKTVIGW